MKYTYFSGTLLFHLITYFGDWSILAAGIYVFLSEDSRQAPDQPRTINQAPRDGHSMGLQSFPPLMNTLVNVSVLTLFLLHFWGAWYTQDSGEGAAGDMGVTVPDRTPGSPAGEAAPPMTFGEGSGEQCYGTVLKGSRQDG